MKTALLAILTTISLATYAQNGTIYCSFSGCVKGDRSQFTITHNGFVLGRTDSEGVFDLTEKIEGPVEITHPLCKPYILSSISRGRKAGDYCLLELR